MEQNLNLTPVSSSNVESIGKDGEDLLVRFQRSSKVYRYKGAAEKFGPALEADSVGRFINQEIKGAFEVESFDPSENGHDG